MNLRDPDGNIIEEEEKLSAPEQVQVGRSRVDVPLTSISFSIVV
jgi:hypothetical protein